MALGALAALTFALASLASLRMLDVANLAMHRFERREAKEQARRLAEIEKAEKRAAKAERPPKTEATRRHRHRQTVPLPSPSACRAPAQPFELDALGPATKDPIELRRRVGELAKQHPDLAVVRAHAAAAALASLLAKDAHTLALTPDPPVAPTGLRLQGVAAGSAVEAMGLKDGDVIKAVNGGHVVSASDLVQALAASRNKAPRVALVELVRRGRLVVLDVTWDDSPG